MTERFTTSTRCGDGNCVGVHLTPTGVRVRDTKHPDGPVLVFAVGEWQAFVAGAKDGEFDPPTPATP